MAALPPMAAAAREQRGPARLGAVVRGRLVPAGPARRGARLWPGRAAGLGLLAVAVWDSAPPEQLLGVGELSVMRRKNVFLFQPC